MATANPLPSHMTIDGHKFLAAPLQSINYQLLEKKDPGEVEKLVRNCEAPGFFYLDLKDSQGYLPSLEVLYKLSKEYFDQSDEVKMRDFRASQERGFKPGDAETFEISRDELVQGLPVLPEIMGKESQLVNDFAMASHAITKTMLSRLAEALKMPQLEASHREGFASACGLKLESAPLEERLEDVPPSEHTDMGTLTLLFCPEYTTEIRMPGTGEWAFVVPKPGHAIVNVADSLQKLSKGKLLSCLHRVGQPTPGAGERFCALYYLRPESSLGLCGEN